MSKNALFPFPDQKGGHTHHTHTHTYISPFLYGKWETAKIRHFCDNLPETSIVGFKCIGIEDVHEKLIDDGTKIVKEIKPMMKVGTCCPEGSTEYFTVIDSTGYLRFGHNMMTIKQMKPEEIMALPKYDRWKSLVTSECYNVLDVFDVDGILRQMRKCKLSFRDLVDFVIDDTGEKDNILIDIAKASRLPIPIEFRQRFQPLNCNFIILGNSGIGKSLTFSRLLGVDSPQSITEAGLIGGIHNIKGLGSTMTFGILNGEGVAIVDEAGRSMDDTGDETPIIEKCLNYTESGEARRSLVQPIVCNGTKSIVVLGNSDMNDTDLNGLKRFIERKCTVQSVERVGRRFPVIIYRHDLKKVGKHDSDFTLVDKCRFVIDTLLMRNRKKITEILNYGLPWILGDDKFWKKSFVEISELAQGRILKELITGISDAHSRVRMAAMKVSVMNNFDMILLAKRKIDKNMMHGIVMKEAKEIYSHFLAENLRSFSVIKASPYSKIIIMLRKRVPIGEIMRSTGMSKTTIYRYMQESGIKPYGKFGEGHG
jgi:hypothetical protein